MDIYEKLREALKTQIQKHQLSGQNISVRCKALTATEAIGNPEHNDYPIIKGKEVMVEAVFQGARGQAFADEFENRDYVVDDLVTMRLDSNKKRASFVAGLNAIFRYLDLCDRTIHCKDQEPIECASRLFEAVAAPKNVLLVGYQPRFLETLARRYDLRVLDMDQDNVGRQVAGVLIEPPEMRTGAIAWCDLILASGSTLVNGTLPDFVEQGKPVIFYGVTISAAAKILNLQKFCHCGH